MLPVEQPFKTYTSLDGKPLDNGYVYFGLPNQDPIAHPVTVYWDAAGTLPALQPLRTVKGYIMRAGAAANVFYGGAYSELVLDSKNRQVFYAADSSTFSVYTPVGAALAQINASLNVFSQPSTGRVFANEGAHVNRVNDRLFVGEVATQYDGNGPAVITSWVGQPSGGIYQYLETNTTFGAYARGSGIGMFAAGRSSETFGTPFEVAIGMASFVHQDKPSGTAGVWNFYGTALRSAGAQGPTHCMELDIANLGNTAVADPYGPNPMGVTNGIRICAGGETEGTGTNSYALGIISNDPAYAANFEKGIVFHNRAIAGTDGINGVGTAIALAKGHALKWYNQGHEECAYLYSAVSNRAAGHGVIFTDSGMRIVSVVDQSTQFEIAPMAGAANNIIVIPAAAGAAPIVTVNGSDANQDLMIGGKGTGLIHFVQSTVTPAGSAGTPAISNYLSIKVNGVSFKLPLYS